MQTYRRFVSYVYQYENGKKAGNRGFIKVEARGNTCSMHISLKGVCRDENAVCSVYGFKREDGLLKGSLLAECPVKTGVVQEQLVFARNEMGRAKYGLQELSGVIFQGDDQTMYGTQWDDDPMKMENFQPDERNNSIPDERDEPAAEKAEHQQRWDEPRDGEWVAGADSVLDPDRQDTEEIETEDSVGADASVEGAGESNDVGKDLPEGEMLKEPVWDEVVSEDEMPEAPIIPEQAVENSIPAEVKMKEIWGDDEEAEKPQEEITGNHPVNEEITGETVENGEPERVHMGEIVENDELANVSIEEVPESIIMENTVGSSVSENIRGENFTEKDVPGELFQEAARGKNVSEGAALREAAERDELEKKAIEESAERDELEKKSVGESSERDELKRKSFGESMESAGEMFSRASEENAMTDGMPPVAFPESGVSQEILSGVSAEDGMQNDVPQRKVVTDGTLGNALLEQSEETGLPVLPQMQVDREPKDGIAQGMRLRNMPEVETPAEPETVRKDSVDRNTQEPEILQEEKLTEILDTTIPVSELPSQESEQDVPVLELPSQESGQDVPVSELPSRGSEQDMPVLELPLQELEQDILAPKLASQESDQSKMDKEKQAFPTPTSENMPKKNDRENYVKPDSRNPCPFSDGVLEECRKIRISDLKFLDPRDQSLRNNRFVQHGYQMFGHLLLARISRNGQYILGVPGMYQQQEKFMADMFGFHNFKYARRSGQKPSNFGYWYRLIYPPKLSRGDSRPKQV